MPFRRFNLSHLALGVATLATPSVYAQSAASTAAVYDLAIAAQPLGSALAELARVANLQLSVRPEAVAGKSAPAVAGRMTASQALSRLLAGSGLVSNISDNRVTVTAAASGASGSGGSSLAPVAVTAKAEAIQGKDTLQTKKTQIGRGTQDIRDIPQSITVITERLMQDRKIETLNEALRMTGGVTFSAAENGTQQDIFIRGFSVAQVGDLLIDGMKDPSLYERDTFNYERIEVLRGSASMIFGRGSTGGVVNQVMKKPMLADQNDYALTLGSRGLMRGTADLNVRTDETQAMRLNLMYTKSQNSGQQINKFGIAPSYSWGLGTQDEITASLYYLDTDNAPKAGLPYSTLFSGYKVNPNNYYGAATDTASGKATYADLQHVHRFGDGGELRSHVRVGDFKRERFATQTRLTDPILSGNSVMTRSGLTPRRDKYQNSYFQSDYSNTYNLLGMKHNLLTGIDGAHEEADRFNATNTAGTPNAGTRGSTILGRPNDGYLAIQPLWAKGSAYSQNSLGAYVQDLAQVAEHWKVLAGVRWDYMRGTYSSTGITAVPAQAATSASLSNSVFSHRFGVLYQPTPTASFHASYGTSFNTSADTYQFSGANQTAVQQSANTPPEKSRNIEIGAKLDWLNGNLSTRGALYRTEKYNERTTDADFAGDALLLSGKRHTQGVELDVVGRITPDLEMYFSLSRVFVSKIDAAGSTALSSVGQQAGLVPKWSGSAWISYRVAPKFRIGAGMNAASENYSINGTTPTKGARAPGYAIFDALAEYKITPDTYVQLNLQNLTNRLYGAELYRGFYIQGDGRTVRLTVGTRF